MVRQGLITPPLKTMKVCTARKWTQPPHGGDASCVNANAWSRVPALSTACCSDQDPWLDRSRAVLNSVQEEHERQNRINAAIDQQFQQRQADDPPATAQILPGRRRERRSTP